MSESRLHHLWAPWRAAYVSAIDQGKSCILCARRRPPRSESPDAPTDLVVQRGRVVFVMMNRFPYNNGHLMIAPYRHIGDLERLTAAEREELHEFLVRSIEILKARLHPHGFNVGMNLGRVAGAGVEHHLHMHVVPRWNGDTNFMTVLGETRVVSEHLLATYKLLKRDFSSQT